MELSLFINPNSTSLHSIEKIETKQSQNKKPFKFAYLLVFLPIILFILYNTNTNQTKFSNSEKLQILVDKIAIGSTLSENEWNELCNLLAIVKEIDVKDCNECRSFLKAMLGGEHKGHYARYKNISDNELLKGIKSYDKQIKLHYDKIKNPESYIENWNTLDPREREALLNEKWNDDIRRLSQQKEIFECILKNRLP